MVVVVVNVVKCCGGRFVVDVLVVEGLDGGG